MKPRELLQEFDIDVLHVTEYYQVLRKGPFELGSEGEMKSKGSMFLT